MTNTKAQNFEISMIPHLDAAYNLARWLTRDGVDAEDVVQEAYLRAFKFFDGFRGGDSRAWILRIVRNTCYSWLQKNKASEFATEFDEMQHSSEGRDAESLLIGNIDRTTLHQLISDLPVEFRETFILREVEGMSYKEIAAIADLPLGTVMSRLARARQRLQTGLISRAKEESK